MKVYFSSQDLMKVLVLVGGFLLNVEGIAGDHLLDPAPNTVRPIDAGRPRVIKNSDPELEFQENLKKSAKPTSSTNGTAATYFNRLPTHKT